MGALLGTLLLSGVVIIISNYAGLFPDEQQNARLFYGLGLIAAGFIVSTRWH